MIVYDPIIQTLKTETSQRMDVLRLDLLDKEISGNKWFKLRHNIEKAKQQGYKTILTFGGAFSNHIAATAAACNRFNINVIGVIRGGEEESRNQTILDAKKHGMVLYFVDRETYSKKNETDFIEQLKERFGPFYLIPEGGNNKEGMMGCMDIIQKEWDYDYVFCACGTGTTYAGILAAKKQGQKIVGISVLKGENKLPREAESALQACFDIQIKVSGNEALEKKRMEDDCIISAYAFKGYARLDHELIRFKKEFEEKYGIVLDHVYTVKLMFAVFDMIQKDKLKKDARVLVVHSGGLQGNKGFEERYHLSPSL